MLSTDTTDTLRLAIYQLISNGIVKSPPTHPDPQLWYPTRAQVQAVAEIYDMIQGCNEATNGSVLSAELHAARPDMILTAYNDLTFKYDSLADWAWMNAHENMFSHSTLSPFNKHRIENPLFPSPLYGLAGGAYQGVHSWLMNPFDLDTQDTGRLDRYVNYYTASSLDAIRRDRMDGLVIDEAMNPYTAILPDGYDETGWHQAVHTACAFVRQRLGPDRVIFWNGVQEDYLFTPVPSVLASTPPSTLPVSIDLLDYLDGAVIEFFVTEYFTAGSPVTVLPQPIWEYTMNVCMAIERRGGALLCQSPVGADNTDIRMLTLASFYLIKGRRSYLQHGTGGQFNTRGGPNWYPEWGIRMGAPLATGQSVTDYLLTPTGTRGASAANLGADIGNAVGVAYAREYEHGVVLANPSLAPSVVRLSRAGYLAHGAGGGEIPPDGSLPRGNVTFTPAQQVQLAPNSGAIVLWQRQAPGTFVPQRPRKHHKPAHRPHKHKHRPHKPRHHPPSNQPEHH